MLEGNFWNDSNAAQKTVSQVNTLKRRLNPFREIEQRSADLTELIELAREYQDADSAIEAAQEYNSILKALAAFELIVLLDKPNDPSSCYVTINSGAGGTEVVGRKRASTGTAANR